MDLVLHVVPVAQAPHLHPLYRQFISPARGERTVAISDVFSIIHSWSIEVFINPKFKIFLIVIAAETKTFAFLGFFLRNAIDVEVVVSAFALIGGEELDGGMYGEHEASDIALVG